MADQNILEENKTVVCLAAFMLAIVPTSITVSFAAFVGNEYLLALALLPCVITLALSIIPTSLSAKTILTCGAMSFLISVTIIVYTTITHLEKVKTLLPLP